MNDNEQKVTNVNKWAICCQMTHSAQLALNKQDLEDFENVLKCLNVPYKVFSFVYSVDEDGKRNYKE